MMTQLSRRDLLQRGGVILSAVQLGGCGYVLYPERVGQDIHTLRLDWGVVILDGLLCLLFIVPGVVAFVVDVSSGCIYMPAPEPVISHQPVRRWLRSRRPEDVEAGIVAASGLSAGRADPRLRVLQGPEQPLDLAMLSTLCETAPDVGRPASAVSLVLSASGEVCGLHVPA